MAETPTKAALEVLLKDQKDIIDQAWDLFGKSENIAEMLDLVGSALYTLNMTYEPNMRTLRQWHSNMWSANDLSDDTVKKKMDDINSTMSEVLGRPVDIHGLTEEQMDALIDEAMAKGIVSDLRDLNNRLWGTGE
jgi:fructose 1,6-bisphosphatase